MIILILNKSWAILMKHKFEYMLNHITIRSQTCTSTCISEDLIYLMALFRKYHHNAEMYKVLWMLEMWGMNVREYPRPAASAETKHRSSYRNKRSWEKKNYANSPTTYRLQTSTTFKNVVMNNFLRKHTRTRMQSRIYRNIYRQYLTFKDYCLPWLLYL